MDIRRYENGTLVAHKRHLLAIFAQYTKLLVLGINRTDM